MLQAVLLALASSAIPAFAAERAFGVGPPGAWVLEAPNPVSALADAAESTGIRNLLFDQQLRAAEDGREDYYRTVWTAETTAGLQDASEIEISFDPSFQKLTIHHVRVTRRGRTVWSFSARDVRVIQAERDLAERLYNGDLTAIVFLKGLRVGDTVDYAYTLAGENPVLGGRFDAVLRLGYGFPVDVIQRRLVWQRQSAPQVRARAGAPEPAVSPGATGTVYTWKVTGAHPPAVEGSAPTWYQPYATVELSEFGDWTEVAKRFRELFASIDAPAPSLDELARRYRLSGASEDARIDQAVRFVQDEVRYLGVEIGPSSHRPHPPAETLERRFGDCKDKASLLVALLRRMGVSAWPALVATRSRQTLDERLPSLFAFDHAIVALRIAGGLQFVDATASEQGGHVRDQEPPPYSRALVLDDTGSGLVAIPEPASDVPTADVEETYALDTWGHPARLEVVSTYRGEDANAMRRSQARTTRASTGKSYRAFYAQEYPEIQELHPPTLEDDRDTNVLVVRESYEVPNLLEQGARDFHAWFIDEQLEPPRTTRRATPLAMPYPDHVRHTLMIRLPGPLQLDLLHQTVDGTAFTVEATRTLRGNEAKLVYSYRTLRGSLPPGEVAAHVEALERASDLLSCRVSVRRASATGASATGPSAPRTDDATGAWVVLGVLGCGLGAGLVWGVRASLAGWRTRRRRRAFQASASARPGEEPRLAIPVETADDVAQAGSFGSCACGGAWSEMERSALVYDHRPMTAVTSRCLACSAERTLYFRVG